MDYRLMILCLVFGTIQSGYAQNDLSSELKFLKKEIEKASKVDEKLITNSIAFNSEDISKLKDTYQRISFNNEDFNNHVETTLIANLRTAIESMNLENFQDSLTDSLIYEDITKPIKLKLIDGIKFGTNNSFEQKKGKVEFISNFNAYLKNYKSIEYADAVVLESFALVDNGIKPFSTFSLNDSVRTKIKLDIRGKMPSLKPRNDKFEIWVDLIKKEGTYKIAKIDILKMQTVQLLREPAFQKIISNAGFDLGKVYPRLEALRRGGYAIALEDFNNDGKLDAFVGNYGESTLWHGTKNGNFVEIPMPEINNVTLAKAAAFVDFNNDGLKDLIVTRFAADKLVGDFLLFKNVNGNFKEVKNALPSEVLRDYAMPMAIADYNNDGQLDVYIGFPGARDFSAGNDSDKKLVTNGLFINKGNFNFEDKTKDIEGGDSNAIFPHGAMASDFNMDGKMDLIVMDDQKNLSPMYQNVDNNSFKIKNEKFKVMNFGYGMGIAAGDFNLDGKQDYLLSNATFNTQNRLEKMKGDFLRKLDNTTDFKAPPAGMRLFLSSTNESFNEVTNLSALDDSGEAAGGVTVVDYDNDGLLDIYLVNGLWSGSSRDNKIDSLFAKSVSLGIVNGHRSPNAPKSIFMKILMQDNVKTDAGQKSMSFAGYQRNRLFKNLGNGEFLEVGFLEGIDSMSDGYMSVVADLNHDNTADLVLRNCDPGALDNSFPPIEVFQNKHTKNKAAWIKLKGTKSNSMGVGAKLFATIGNKTHYREIFANNSAAQGDVSAHFGFGKNSSISKLKIMWPSGSVETFKNISAGAHTFVEK